MTPQHDEEHPRPLPTCINHPGRATVGGFDNEWYCHECVGAEIARRTLWQQTPRRIVGVKVQEVHP